MTSPIMSTILSPLAGIVLAMTGLPTAEASSAASHGDDAARSGAPESQAPPTEDRAAPEATGTEGIVRQTAADTGKRRSALEYWTSERMEAAQSRDRLPEEPLPDSAPTGDVDIPRAGLQGARSPNGEAERWTSGGGITKATGKVFVTMADRDFTCSAAVVPAENRDTVITAGHCLKDGTGAWADNWTFVPGYEDGEAPYGRYVAREMLVAPEWSEEADDSFDFGMVVLHESDGAHVQDETGAQEIDFGDHEGRRTYAFGYPSMAPYDGRRLHYCSGRPEADRGKTTATGMACDMTEGASGGPWLTDFDAESGEGTITSVVSFKYADDSSTQFGPRLGDEARRLYETAASL
ncbi:trypsin-like serine peptidase [Allosalinactinospora lopnorensis]|uniref:trypsin-like serine peptidase n=1 Tax=Allosalinactinospora lopnorensis TaxID=1352348 RepID=UPI000623CDF9|nr:trypsin-like serine protease [Allosalinactinospora lopnorensis]